MVCAHIIERVLRGFEATPDRLLACVWSGLEAVPREIVGNSLHRVNIKGGVVVRSTPVGGVVTWSGRWRGVTFDLFGEPEMEYARREETLFFAWPYTRTCHMFGQTKAKPDPPGARTRHFVEMSDIHH